MSVEKFGTQESGKEKKMSGREKFEILLGIFGTDKARDNFLSVCREYLASRKSSVKVEDAENYSPESKVRYSSPRRAELHNYIMETMTLLATEAKDLTPEEEEALKDLHSREAMAQAIKEYVLAEEHREDDDEDEVAKKQSGMSPTAYFHSLGKGE